MVACVLFSSYFAYGEGPQDVLMGMQIERIDHNTVAPRVVTTGAEFLLQEDGWIHCFQRIPKQREVARIELPGEVLPLKLEPQNDFRCLVAGQGLDLVIQGDSLVILKARRDIKLAFEGRFTPVYHAGTEGKWMFIDEEGGFGIYPVEKKETKPPVFAENPWRIEYKMTAGEEIWVSVFPPRPYNWKRAYVSEQSDIRSLRQKPWRRAA